MYPGVILDQRGERGIVGSTVQHNQCNGLFRSGHILCAESCDAVPVECQTTNEAASSKPGLSYGIVSSLWLNCLSVHDLQGRKRGAAVRKSVVTSNSRKYV